MKRLVAVVAAVAMLAALADDAELVKVKGRGVGANKTEALKDAYRDAVERAVGLYVDAEQMVKNEELVNDQILTHSNAYVERYDIAKESKSGDGQFSVTILAEVRKRALTRRIRDVMPANMIDLSDVSKNLHAQIVSDFKANDDALTIIRNELKELQPLKQLMNVTLGTTQPVVEPVNEDHSKVRLWYPIKVEVDADRYYSEFAPRWGRILDQIKLDSAKRLDLRVNWRYLNAYNAAVAKEFGTTRKNRRSVMTRCDVASKPNHYCDYLCSDVFCKWGVALNEEYNDMLFLNTLIDGKDYILYGCQAPRRSLGAEFNDVAFRDNGREVRRIFSPDFSRLQEWFDNDSVFYIGLVTTADSQSMSGRLFRIPMDCVNEIVGWQHMTVCGKRVGDGIRNTAQAVEYRLHFVDQNKNEIASRTFSLLNLEILNFSCAMLEEMERKSGDNRYGCDYTGGTQLWLISPLVGGFAISYVKWISIDILKDDVAKMSSASISVNDNVDGTNTLRVEAKPRSIRAIGEGKHR